MGNCAGYPTSNAANIRLLEDSIKTVVQPRLSIDSVEKRSLLVHFPWKEGANYELQVLNDGVTDLFGLRNADTIVQKIAIGLRKDFGTLTLKATRLDSSKAYVIHLLEKPDAPPLRQWEVSNSAEFKVKLNLLPPAIYTVELIEDLDRNGRWTTGSYDLHRQPERIVRKTLEQLRANWELEATVEWQE